MKLSQALAGVAREASEPVALALLDAAPDAPPGDGELAVRIPVAASVIKKLGVDAARARVSYADGPSLLAVWNADKRKSVRMAICRAAAFPGELAVEALEWLENAYHHYEARQAAAALLSRCSFDQLVEIARTTYEFPVCVAEALAAALPDRDTARAVCHAEPALVQPVLVRMLAHTVLDGPLTGSDVVEFAGDQLATVVRHVGSAPRIEAEHVARIVSDATLAEAVGKARLIWATEAQHELVAQLDVSSARDGAIRLALTGGFADLVADALTDDDLDNLRPEQLVELLEVLDGPRRDEVAERLAGTVGEIVDDERRRMAVSAVVFHASAEALCAMLDRDRDGVVHRQVLAALGRRSGGDPVPGEVLQRLVDTLLDDLPDARVSVLSLLHPDVAPALRRALIAHLVAAHPRPTRGVDMAVSRLLGQVRIDDDQVVAVVLTGAAELEWLGGEYPLNPPSLPAVLELLGTVPEPNSWASLYAKVVAYVGRADIDLESSGIGDVLVARASESDTLPGRLVEFVPLTDDQAVALASTSITAAKRLVVGTDTNPVTPARRKQIMAVREIDGRAVVSSFLRCPPDDAERDAVRASLAYQISDGAPYSIVSKPEMMQFLSRFGFADDEVAALLAAEPALAGQWVNGEFPANPPNDSVLRAALDTTLAQDPWALIQLAGALSAHQFGRAHLVSSAVFLDAVRRDPYCVVADRDVVAVRFVWEYLHEELGDDLIAWRYVVASLDEWSGSLATLIDVARALGAGS